MKTKKLNTALLNLSLLAGMLIFILFAANTYAVTVDIDADVADADCFWADGPGSELYVPNGKTCTLTNAPTASNITDFTDYAVIVYPGGTLNIGTNTMHTTFTVSGDILNMGTINIGDGGTHMYSSTLRTVSSGKLLMKGSGSLLEAKANAGIGGNTLVVDGDVELGDSTDTDPVMNLYDNTTDNDTGNIISYGTIRIYAGALTANSIYLKTPDSGTSGFRIDTGATVETDSYFTIGTDKIALAIGTSAGTGDALMSVYGSLIIPNYPADNVNVLIGDPSGNGTLTVQSGGVVDINETNTFGAPPNGSPSNNIKVQSSEPYGLNVAGTMNTAMFLLNEGGIVTVDSKGANTGRLYAENHYKQSSGLIVAAGDEMWITGTAEIDGDSQIDGTLNISDCAKITNTTGEDFNIGSTGTFQSGDNTCALLNTGTDDGLNVQGAYTTFNIANGASVNITGDLTTDEFGNIDADGYFVASGKLYVLDGTTVNLSDTDTGDHFEVFNVYMEAPTNKNGLTIAVNSVLDLTDGAITVGKTGSLDTATLLVEGTLNIPSSSSAAIQINYMGRFNVSNTGLVQDDATDSQPFSVASGGSINCDGTINITNQQFVMNTGSFVRIRDEGLLNSSSTVTPAFDYNGGELLIDDGTSGITNGAMKFDDTIDVDTAEKMTINGYLEGTNEIDYNGTMTSSSIGPSGEMKVVTGTGTPVINIHRTLGLYGKLNAADGAGTLNILGTNSPVVGGPGGTGIDSYAYILAGELNLESGASINVSNFIESYDAGGGHNYGGSYGGLGGGGGTTTFGDTKYFTQPNYDTAVQNPVGMFGFIASSGLTDAYGGGGIYIEAKKTIFIEGTIRANGENNPDNGTGAGSGGLIVINHNISHSDLYGFKGTGTIEANGGDGTGTTDSYGGGGGRIIIKSILFDDPDDDETNPPHYDFTGTIRARGGAINNGSTYAAAGTIVYLGDDNSPNDTLIVDQENRTFGSSVYTLIPNEGNYIFDRVEARNGADISFANDPATFPVSCFDYNSEVTYPSAGKCVANPDKPDTLYINNSVVGAQSGDEPWVGAPVLVGDLTPSFSLIARNPENSSTVSKVRVQVTNDPADFDNPSNYRTCPTDCIWDSDVTLSSATSINSRSVDFEYAGPALSVGTPYYVRMAFYDNSGTNLGLWTHRDLDNHYNFEINDALWIDPLCIGDSFNITDYNDPGKNIKTQNGKRFGWGTCEIGVISGNSGNWEILFGMDSGEGTDQAIAFNTQANNLGDDIDPIDNSTTCDMEEAGTENSEKYGFNLANVNVGSASTDTEGACNTIDFDTNQKYHDVEIYNNMQRVISGTSMETDTFDLNLYANISNATVPSTYTLDMFLVLTPIP